MRSSECRQGHLLGLGVESNLILEKNKVDVTQTIAEAFHYKAISLTQMSRNLVKGKVEIKSHI